MGIDIFQGTILHHQLCGSLLPHLWYAGNIVGSIAHQGFQVDELEGHHLISGLHILRVIILHLGFPHLRLGYPDLDMLVRNLQQIPVAGYQGYLHTFRLSLFRQGSQNIVRLQALLLHNHHPHGPEYVLHHRHLLS